MRRKSVIDDFLREFLKSNPLQDGKKYGEEDVARLYLYPDGVKVKKGGNELKK